jgi:hypothetical protein
MPSKSDHSAGDLETENADGFLAGFLAEEEGLDRSSLLRLGTWAAASAGAVIVALLVNHSEIGLRREQVAAADLARQSQQIQSLARESQTETRRLVSAIDTLNSDRDRLFSRVGVLEQGLDSVTGAIARQAANPAPQAVAAPSPKADPKPAAQNPTPAPVVAPVAATPAIPPASSATERQVSPPAPQAGAPSVKADAKSEPNTDGKIEPQAAAANPPPVVVAAPVAPTAPVEKPGVMAAKEPTPAAPKSTGPGDPAAATVVTLMPAKSLMAPPDPAAAAKLIEPAPSADAVKAAPVPETIAAAPPSEDDAPPAAAAAERSKVAVQRTEFGADVGGANSLNGLRALWRGLLKSNKELADLRPVVVVKESKNGMQLRLVAGPLTDAAAAANICARLMESQRPCQTTVFDGQSLAMKADEPAAPAKPAVRSRSAAKRAAAEEPAKKPEFSATSWLFGKR